jgi:hypothetical protein
MPKIHRQEINGVARLLFMVCLLAGIAASPTMHPPWPAISGAVVGLYFLFAIKVVWRLLSARFRSPGCSSVSCFVNSMAQRLGK